MDLNIDTYTLGWFWNTFRLSISVSLLGALIGHYSKNGAIQFPLIVIPYEKSDWVIRGRIKNRFFQFVTPILVIIDFVLFLFGIRWNTEQVSKANYVDLGFLGDVLIGIGTGVLAKTAIEFAGTDNIFAEISAAFIAGFAGLSYIKERQNDLNIEVPSSVEEDKTPSEPTVLSMEPLKGPESEINHSMNIKSEDDPKYVFVSTNVPRKGLIRRRRIRLCRQRKKQS